MKPETTDIEGRLLVAATIPEATPGILDALKPEDFNNPTHRLIFNAMQELFNSGNAVTWLDTMDSLKADGKFDDAVWNAFTGLKDMTRTAANWKKWSAELSARARLQSFLSEAEKIVAAGNKAPKDIDAYLERSIQRLVQLGGAAKDKAPDKHELLNAAWEQLEAAEQGRAAGLGTGISELDKLTGGLQPGQLWIVGARPSSGKSSLALQVAINNGLAGQHALLVSYEQEPSELMTRALIQLSGRTRAEVQSKKRSKEAWRGFEAARTQLEAATFDAMDGRGRGTPGIRALAEKTKAEKGLSLLLVDYLGLVRGPSKAKSREQEVSAISRELKEIASGLKVPLVACAQLSRKSEERPGGTPFLSDLRDSGGQEQDADCVVMIHRYGKYEKDGNPEDARLIVAKNRNGPTGTVNTRFNETSMRFETKEGYNPFKEQV